MEDTILHSAFSPAFLVVIAGVFCLGGASGCGTPSNRALDPERASSSVDRSRAEAPERTAGDRGAERGAPNTDRNRAMGSPERNPSLNDPPSSEALMKQLLADQQGSESAVERMMKRAQTFQTQADRAQPDELAAVLPDTFKNDSSENDALNTTERRSQRAFSKPPDGNPHRGHRAAIAEAEYRVGIAGRVSIRISDLGTASPLLATRRRAWKSRSISVANDLEFARLVEISGYPGFEEFRADVRAANLEAIVRGRYLIEVRGRGVFSDTVRDLFDRVKLDQLPTDSE